MRELALLLGRRRLDREGDAGAVRRLNRKKHQFLAIGKQFATLLVELLGSELVALFLSHDLTVPANQRNQNEGPPVGGPSSRTNVRATST
jgi:hypothetical protein